MSCQEGIDRHRLLRLLQHGLFASMSREIHWVTYQRGSTPRSSHLAFTSPVQMAVPRRAMPGVKARFSEKKRSCGFKSRLSAKFHS